MLLELFSKYKAQKVSAYGILYELLFNNIRNDNLTLLEIGICDGYSMLAWCDYFPNARLFGIDIKSITGDVGRATILKGNQANSAFLREVINNVGEMDIVIDDASHRPADQIASLKVLLPNVKHDGYYIIEDLHDGGRAAVVDYLDSIHANYVLYETEQGKNDMCVVRTAK